MKNTLVELNHAYERAREALYRTDPTVADLYTQIEVADAALAELVAQAKKEHTVDRSVATRPDTAAEIKAALTSLVNLRAQRKAAERVAGLMLKPGFEQLKAAHDAEKKACRQQYGQDGLYWASYNMVLDRHKASVKLVKQHRQQGRAARLRFKRWDGTGVIAVQLQRANGDPQRDPRLIASGAGKWRNVFQIKPWINPTEFNRLSKSERKRAGLGECVINVGAGRQVRLPIRVYRMIPADADICSAELVITKTAGQWNDAYVCVTVIEPEPEPVVMGPTVALHCGWRNRPDGSVRVGYWASTQRLTVPDNLQGWVTAAGGGRWGEIIVPAERLKAAERPAELRSTRDLNLAPVQAKLAAWLDEHPQPDRPDGHPHPTGNEVRRWRSAHRFVRLALNWRDSPPIGDDGITDLMNAWRKQDKHLWTWEANSRLKDTDRRDTMWREVGAWLGSVAGCLVVDDTDFAALRRRPDVADDDPTLPGVVQAKARARSTLVAPGRLRSKVVWGCKSRGVPIREVSAAPLTRTCPNCKVLGKPHPRYAAAATVTCPACGVAYDQDWSATQLMICEPSDGESGTLNRSQPAERQ